MSLTSGAINEGEQAGEKLTDHAVPHIIEIIEAFFQRHAIPYTYDASIRRYFGTAAIETRGALSVYVYTDTDKKMTVTLVQLPKPAAPMRPERRMPAYLDLPGATRSGPPRF